MEMAYDVESEHAPWRRRMKPPIKRIRQWIRRIEKQLIEKKIRRLSPVMVKAILGSLDE